MDQRAAVTPPPIRVRHTIAVSTAYAHHGRYAAELAINAGPDGTQQNTGLRLINELPTEAYYSAWYYLPQTITVGTFWLLFKYPPANRRGRSGER